MQPIESMNKINALRTVLGEEAIQTIHQMADDLRTQDARCTAHPVYAVQVAKDCIQVDGGPNFDWLDENDVRCDKGLEDRLEKADSHGWDDVEYEGQTYVFSDFRKVFWVADWQTEACFLTNRAAEEYIQTNLHNLDRGYGKPRIYVASGHLNPQHQLLRRLIPLLSLTVLNEAQP